MLIQRIQNANYIITQLIFRNIKIKQIAGL